MGGRDHMGGMSYRCNNHKAKESEDVSFCFSIKHLLQEDANNTYIGETARFKLKAKEKKPTLCHN